MYYKDGYNGRGFNIKEFYRNVSSCDEERYGRGGYDKISKNSVR
ncbi:hypothetical protein [Candidatus Ichthyocystis hellenicum]|nr:hypothetical protein [Candidatus Ichthyocystis hellenicum]